jgi:hypothetical protein
VGDRLLGGNPRTAAPSALAPRQPLWAGTNTHTEGGPTTPMTNILQFSNPPPAHSHNSANADVKTGPKLIKHRGGESLREDVGEL